MTVALQRPSRQRRAAHARKRGLYLEVLESRTQPSAVSWPGLTNPVASMQGIGTLDQAQSLGDLTTTPQLAVVGKIASGSADVNWYSFTLDNPARVVLATLNAAGHSSFVSELGVYVTDFDSTNDPYILSGSRLLAQDDGAAHGGDAHIERALAAGTYYVAVSGSGNRFFHPDIADSGLAGSSGGYGLSIAVQDLGIGATDGPVVLATDLTNDGTSPASDAGIATVNQSPFIIRVDVSSGLDPNTLIPGQNIQLVDLNSGQPIGVTAYFDASVNELKLTPAAPLPPDDYQLTLSGDSSNGAAVIGDLSGNPLGASATHPFGQDYTFTFRIAGSEGIVSSSAMSDATPATAHELGDLSHTNLIQAVGAIGLDPSDPVPFNPADVNLYHFQLSGSASYAVRLDVFAGRIASPLDSEVSLFRVNPVDGLLHLIALNDNTNNGTFTFDKSQQPLALDSDLTAGLTAGDYYVAVTGSGYVPAALTDSLYPAPYSVFDLTLPQPFGGTTTGAYVLNVSVIADNTPPAVISASVNDAVRLTDGARLSAPPTSLTVAFSEPVNLQQPATRAFVENHDTGLGFVYIVGPAGTFLPRFSSFTNDGAVARFLMYDALPSGHYELHLSGPGGLTDLAGNPLVGNSPSGDYVISFTVNAPPRGSSQGPNTWIVQNRQNLGPLFPGELQHVVTLARPGAASAGDAAYQVQLLQNQRYTISLGGTPLPAGAQFSITDASGATVKGRVSKTQNNIVIVAVLAPGVYTIRVHGWTPAAGFSISIAITRAAESAPALTVGAGAAVPLRSLTGVLPPPPVNQPTDLATVKLPSTTGTAGVIVPVSLVSSSARAASGLIAEPGSVPAEVLVGLGAGQLGGITATSTTTLAKTSDVYDRVIAFGPDPALAQLLVQLPVLVQLHDSGLTQDLVPPVPGAVAQEIVRVLSKLDWNMVGEFLQGLENWSMDHLLPTTPSGGDEFLPGVDMPAIPELPRSVPSPHDQDNLPAADGNVQALAVAAGLALAGAERKKRSRNSGWDRGRPDADSFESYAV